MNVYKYTPAAIVVGLLIIGQLWSNKLLAQDLHFTQYFHAPLLLSPAETGNHDGAWRAASTYRNQWQTIGNALETGAWAADFNFYTRAQKVSAGLQAVHDESGNFRLIHQKMLVSFAYHHRVAQHRFHAGVQGGWVGKRFISNAFTFPDQFSDDQGVFDRSLPTAETTNRIQIQYLDLNAGIIYGRYIKSNLLEIGISFHHLNTPIESFTGAVNELAARRSYFARYKFDLGRRWQAHAHALWMDQRKATTVVTALIAERPLAANKVKAKAFMLGASSRQSVNANYDALTAMAGLRFQRLLVCLSHDFTFSLLRKANDFHGAYEIALVYTGLASGPVKNSVPCRRL